MWAIRGIADAGPHSARAATGPRLASLLRKATLHDMDDIYPSRWAPKHPERLQLYSMATPNGQKIGIALEELELTYEAHKIDIMEGDQHDKEYTARVNPNGKIPSIIDPEGPDGEPIAIMESGGKFFSTSQTRQVG